MKKNHLQAEARLLWKCLQRHKLFVIVSLVAFCTYTVTSVYKHLHFGSTGYDLVIFDQAIRHYSEFQAPGSSFRGFNNLLGDHFHPILALLAPLYWLYDSPVVLLVAQAALVVSAVIPIYLYSLKKLGKVSALFCAIVFLFSGALLEMINFDFHEIAFAVPLIAWAVYCLEEKKWTGLYVILSLLLLTKESFGILVVFFGIYLLLKRYYLHGTILVSLGIAAFLITTKVIIPYFSGTDTFMYWSYDQLGIDVGSSLVAIIKNPLFAISLLFFPIVKLVTLVKTFAVYLGINFVSPLMLLAIPLLLERFLSSQQNYWQFNYHYGATLVPIATMAFVDGLSRLTSYRFMQQFSKEKVHKLLTGFAAFLTLAFVAISPMTVIAKPSTYVFSDDERKGYQVLTSIDSNTSVCTTNHIAPHLGRHTLTLIGFANVSVLPCDIIVVSQQYDQSVYLHQTMNKATSEGYTLQKELGSWQVYGHSL